MKNTAPHSERGGTRFEGHGYGTVVLLFSGRSSWEGAETFETFECARVGLRRA